MVHIFDEAIAVTPTHQYGFQAESSPAYANVAAAFGGITAATIVHALQSHPESLGRPLSITLNYLYPIKPGPWTIEVHPITTNRTNQHWTFTAAQNDTPVMSGSAVFGISRTTWSDEEITAPPAEDPSTYTPPVNVTGLPWIDRYETRYVEGFLNWQDPQPTDHSVSTYWIRDNPPRPVDYPALASYADSFMPRVIVRRGTFIPAGTVSLTVYFHAAQEELTAQGDQDVLATARAGRFHEGYFEQYGKLFSRSGSLLVTSLQWVYYKDPTPTTNTGLYKPA